jgi:hypothetical protein
MIFEKPLKRPIFTNKTPAGWNKNACMYFQEVNALLSDWGFPIGMHAMNGGEKQFGRYSVDFYIPEYLIIVEYNEAHHYVDRQRIVRDSNRKVYLSKIVNLPILVIHEHKETPRYCAKEIVKLIEYREEKERDKIQSHSIY